MSLVSVSDLSFRIDNKIILEDVHLTVNRDEIVTIIGPNGAGKSTLLKIILNLIPKSEGSVKLAPDLIIGYMPQKLHIEPTFPLSVAAFLSLVGGKKPEKEWLLEISKLLGIEKLLKSPIQTISGGEFQRVLLARALLRHPDLLILDEPAAGIDILGQENFYSLIGTIRQKFHCGILMVSHDLHLVMAETDTVICLNKHVCCLGHPETVTRHPEFLNLFGLQDPKSMAFYTHKHNHTHD